MESTKKSWADIVKAVSGPYQLLGLFLLVVEGLLGYWLHKADSGFERGFAGVLMTLVLLGVLYVVARPRQQQETALSIQPPDKKEATQAEVSAPPPDLIPGPDRSYLINRPPEDWTVAEITMSDWISAGIGVSDPATKKKLFPSQGQSPDILVIDRGKQTSIIPVPGQTTINGRKVPTALEVLAPTQLSVVPMDRYQAPFFVERSLEDGFLTVVGDILKMGATSATHIESGVLASNGRHYLASELQQKLQDAIVNGREHQDLIIAITVIGIRGELRDHLLVMKYTISQGDPELDRNFNTLSTLVASFRPVRPVNPKEEREKITTLAEENFKSFLAEKGEELLTNELGFLLLRLQGVDLEDSDTRSRIIKCLQPFESLANVIGSDDAELASFWDALHVAEKGDATAFKSKLNELIQTVAKQGEEEEETQPETPSLPPAPTAAD